MKLIGSIITGLIAIVLIGITTFGMVAFGVLLVSVLWGIPLMYLWDWLMPTIFGLPEITFW